MSGVFPFPILSTYVRRHPVPEKCGGPHLVRLRRRHIVSFETVARIDNLIPHLVRSSTSHRLLNDPHGYHIASRTPETCDGGVLGFGGSA
jgi:hypothetical protein